MLDAGFRACSGDFLFGSLSFFVFFFVFAVRLCDLVNYVTAFNKRLKMRHGPREF